MGHFRNFLIFSLSLYFLNINFGYSNAKNLPEENYENELSDKLSMEDFIDNLEYELYEIQRNPNYIRNFFRRESRQFNNNNNQGVNYGNEGNQGQGQGGQGQEEEEEDDEEGTTLPGPGAFGILTGLLGIFSGIGTLNPDRIVESTVNFFPPHARPQAQDEINRILGRITVTTTLKPTRNKNKTSTATKVASTALPTTIATAAPTTQQPKVKTTTDDNDEIEEGGGFNLEDGKVNKNKTSIASENESDVDEFENLPSFEHLIVENFLSPGSKGTNSNSSSKYPDDEDESFGSNFFNNNKF